MIEAQSPSDKQKQQLQATRTSSPLAGIHRLLHRAMSTIPLGLYLWKRLKQCGIDHIFGVPGDFNLTLLDHIYNVEGLQWIGSTNEYARIATHLSRTSFDDLLG